MALLVLSLLFFSLCSSVYLLYRVHALQLQVRTMHTTDGFSIDRSVIVMRVPRVNHYPYVN